MIFKINDKVTISDNPKTWFAKEEIGNIGTITSISEHGSYGIKWNNGFERLWYSDEDLKLVSNDKEDIFNLE